MGNELKATVDVNKFIDQGSKIASSLSGGTALVYNDTKHDIRFYCYNASDVVFLISNTKPKIASGSWGRIAAAGEHFKVHPNDHTDNEFLVKPKHAYVYSGPGKVKEV